MLGSDSGTTISRDPDIADRYVSHLNATGQLVGIGTVKELLQLDRGLARGLPRLLMWLGRYDEAVRLMHRNRRHLNRSDWER